MHTYFVHTIHAADCAGDGANRHHPQWRCRLCAAQRHGDVDYFSRAFVPERIAAMAEAVGDALGYCVRHGALLAAHDEWGGTATQVFRLAIEHTLSLLDGKHMSGERFQKIFFAATHAVRPAVAAWATFAEGAEIMVVWLGISIKRGMAAALSASCLVCLPSCCLR